ncbi:MAG: hypothetical protein R6V62_03945 [Candidatus Fermentibacteraceae bacterium]
MVIGSKRPVSPFIAAGLIAAALSISTPSAENINLQQLPVMLALSACLLVSVLFTGNSASGSPLNAFPFVLAMAVTLQGSIQGAFVFGLVSGGGSFFLESSRGGERMHGRKRAFELFASVFLLSRVLSFTRVSLEGMDLIHGLPMNILSLVFLTGFAIAGMWVLPVPRELRTDWNTPILFNLIPMPMVIPLLEARDDPESLLLPLAGTVFLVGIVQLGAFLLTTRRQAIERGMDMERALAELTAELSRAGSVAAALKMMLEKLLKGSGASRVTVTNANLSMSLPVKPSPSACTVSRSLAGLTAVLDYPVMPLVSPERVDAFLTRTSVMLEWIVVSESITRETWESIEALVLSLEKTDEKVAGFSKRVATTVTELAERLGFDSWSVNSLRVASLLHAGSVAIMGGLGNEEPQVIKSMGLPPLTIDALRHHGECWDGTGPQGLSGESIPMGARILAAGIGWEKAFTAGGLKEACRAMRMANGLLFDPALTSLLLELRSGRPSRPDTTVSGLW